MAVIIGIVLSYQNGWLGLGSSSGNLSSEGKFPVTTPGPPSQRGSLARDGAGSQETGSKSNRNRLQRITAGSNGNDDIPVHNLVQVRNPDSSQVHLAGLFPSLTTNEGQSKSFFDTQATTNNQDKTVSLGNIPKNRPVQVLHNPESHLQTIVKQTSNNRPVVTDFNRGNQHQNPLHGITSNNVIIRNNPNLNSQQGISPTLPNAIRNKAVGISLPNNVLHASNIPAPVRIPTIRQSNEQPEGKLHNSVAGGSQHQTPNTQFTVFPVNSPVNTNNPIQLASHESIVNSQKKNQQNAKNIHLITALAGFSNPGSHIIANNPEILSGNHKTLQNTQQDSTQPLLTRQQGTHTIIHTGQPIIEKNIHPLLQNINDGSFAINPQQLTPITAQNTNIILKEGHQTSTQHIPSSPIRVIKNGHSAGTILAPQHITNFPKEGTPSKNIDNQEGTQNNKIHMEKMKMLKEILDAEGSGKLLQDLITLKNNKNTLTAISQHLSDTANGQGIQQPTTSPRSIEDFASRAVLTHKQVLNSTEPLFVKVTSKPSHRKEIDVKRKTDTHSSVEKPRFPPKFKQHPRSQSSGKGKDTTRRRNNIQVVRELLSSLINSPEVQQILRTRNKQLNERQEKSVPQSNDQKELPKEHLQGDEMRALLMKALAKQIPNEESLQRLRLHGPQPSQTQQTGPQNRISGFRRRIPAGVRLRQSELSPLQPSKPLLPAQVTQGRSSASSRTIQKRMGPADSKNETSTAERVNNSPPPAQKSVKASSSPRKTSRGRESPVPHFRLQVKNDGESVASVSTSNRTQEKMVTERVDMRSGKTKGEVMRHWLHMDTDGTVSQGTVRRDGSFAFTNCRPAKLCQGDTKEDTPTP